MVIVLGQILTLILILGIIPFCVGMIPVNLMEKRFRSLGVTYIAGFISILAIFQIIVVPIVILDGYGFKIIVPLFSILSILLGAIGVYLTWRKGQKEDYADEGEAFPFLNFLKREKKEHTIKKIYDKQTREEGILWLFVLILIGFQMFMAFTTTSFDGDDAYYVVQSVLTDETNTLYRIRPYTGLSTGMDLRHSLAVFPIWIAYIARMSGIHATIIAHSVLPLVLIPVTYWIYLQIGKKLLRRDKHKLPVFMIFICLMQIFGNVSIYTGATFFLTRTWQGKSLLANIVLPSIVWLVLWIFDSENYEKEHRVGLWVLLVLTNFVAAMSSTASVFLAAMLIGVTGLVMGIHEKNVQIPLRLMISCVPLVIYGVIFLLL